MNEVMTAAYKPKYIKAVKSVNVQLRNGKAPMA